MADSVMCLLQDNILFSLTNPRGIISLASAMVLLHVVGSYQVFTVPVYDMIEQLALKKGYKMNFASRFAYRTTYVVRECPPLIAPCHGSLRTFS